MSVTGQPGRRDATDEAYVNRESDLVFALRVAYLEIENVLTRLPASRRKSIALTDLESSAMFAIKAAYEHESEEIPT